MNCPVCKVPLIAVERDRIEIDTCISCRGLWFDGSELKLLGEMLQVKLKPSLWSEQCATNEALRKCPKCAKAMVKCQVATAGRILLDRCPDYEGIWFDAHELGAFVDYAATQEGVARPVAKFLGETFGGRS